MPSGLSLQKLCPGIGMVVLVDEALVVLLGLRVVVEADAAVVTAGFLVVVDGSGGISVRGGKTLYAKLSFGSI